VPRDRSEGNQAFLSRRGFVQVAAAVALDLPFARWFEQWRALGHRPQAARVTPFITPNEEFYLVAVDPSFRPAFDPASVESRWSLELVGVDGRRGTLGYSQLLARATNQTLYTFECIGNDIGGQLIGNARWHVIPLKSLLAEVPGGVGGTHSVLFRGLDDFYSSVSAARALDDYAFLALRMNGAPLPAAHGFPARVILPDLYGMKQPRWLKSIALQRSPQTTSFWEKRGWAGEVPVKTMSRLDPRDARPSGQPLELTGIAFAGERGIRAVEVSLDAGENWTRCELLTPGSRDVWSTWRYRWERPTAGRYTLEVRAIDGSGTLQTARRHDSYPDGAAGYDRRLLEIVARK